MKFAKPCSRCPIPTVNPDTGVFDRPDFNQAMAAFQSNKKEPMWRHFYGPMKKSKL